MGFLSCLPSFFLPHPFFPFLLLFTLPLLPPSISSYYHQVVTVKNDELPCDIAMHVYYEAYSYSFLSFSLILGSLSISTSMSYLMISLQQNWGKKSGYSLHGYSRLVWYSVVLGGDGPSNYH